MLIDSYDEDEYFDDLIRVTKSNTDEALARMVIRTSQECLPWIETHGVRFQPSLSSTLSFDRTNALLGGGGMALVNACYRTAQRSKVARRSSRRVGFKPIWIGWPTHGVLLRAIF